MKLAFDTGGTFTDFALLDEQGNVHLHKVRSVPSDPAQAVIQGIDELLDRVGAKVGVEDLRVFGATTVVTNALLERKGARTALITTKGFRDVLRIRTEARYSLYDLKIQYPEPLVPRDLCFGVSERMSADGTVVIALDEDDVCAGIEQLINADCESVAVCLLHSYRFPEHERRIGELMEKHAPGIAVSLSSSICPEIREYDRASTTAINAYTRPIMEQHVAHLADKLEDRSIHSRFFLMTSSGGVVPSETAATMPVRIIESGPAAGALAAAEYGRLADEPNVLSFDMGGTTAKLCLVRDGQPLVAPSFEVARQERFTHGSGFPVKTLSIQMIELGAGGGSIASVDQLGLLRVGPRSAGADPGPACYGFGGTEPTVTDADLELGYLAADSFLGGDFRLHPEKSSKVIARLADSLGVTHERSAWGIHDLVNETMSKAAMVHAVERGVDHRNFTLVAFGGAGPVHAYGVAKKIGIKKIICPLGAGVASALGLLAAPVAVDLATTLPVRMAQGQFAGIKRLLDELAQQGREQVSAAGVLLEDMTYEYSVDMRYVGQGHEISVSIPDVTLPDDEFRSEMNDAFYRAYEQLYGRRVAGSEVEAITWRLRVSGPRGDFVSQDVASDANAQTDIADRPRRAVYFGELGEFVETPVLSHDSLAPGFEIDGPAIVEQRESTAVVGPHAKAKIDSNRNLVMLLS